MQGDYVSVTILIADDHTILRAGLRSLLNAEPDLSVIAEAADGSQAVLLASQLHPDVVVTDINMPGANGIQVTQELQQHVPGTRVLILSMHEDSGLVRQALDAGASGYIVKRAAESELINAVRTVANGGTYIQPEMQRNVTRDLLRHALVAVPSAESLTDQERQLLRYLASGYTNRQIASMMHVEAATVSAWRAELSDKLGLHGRVDLLRYAREQGLVSV
jgi:two-component system, NarL family, response regulator NreC